MDAEWDDVCFAMIMECEPSDFPDEGGFAPPSAGLVAKYCRLYPQFADDLVDFTATCITMDFLAKKFPAPEPTKAEVDRAVRKSMRIFRSALRKADKMDVTKASLPSWPRMLSP